MEPRIVLSIDGRAGAELVQDRESHLRGSGASREHALLTPGSNGRDGINAPPALSGEPAGAVAVEFSRSQLREGGITVKVIGETRAMRSPLPQVTEIPPHTEVHLSAVGGKGEPGRKGGAGAPGTSGQNGSDASRVAEATDGGPGGTGGMGGRGSDGGRGGPGGKILLYVDENQTELLHAVTWDVSGGKEESQVHMAKLEKADQEGREEMLLYGRQMLDGGACRCKGGPAHCPACEKKPIYRTFSKPAGRDGAPGQKGAQRQREDDPFEGEPGIAGSVDIIVRHKNGDRPKYNSKFDLALVSFDVEDGNGDGIFEPGEDILVRQIRVQNKGGMPSPASPIFCQVMPSDLIESSQGDGSHAYLPSSIPAGNVEFTEKSVRCSLKMAMMNARSAPPYASEQTITLRATIPWLKQPLEQFNVAKSITVQFPLEVRNFKLPTALAPRFGYSVRWQILNKGKLLFGTSAGGHRIAKVLVMVDAKQGEMLDQAGKSISSIELTVPDIPPQSSIDMSQRIRAKDTATAHEDLNISLQLFISTPKRERIPQDPSVNSLQLIESHKAKIQVAPGHTPSENDDVLIVTNPAIKKTELEAVVQWLEGELFLKTNVWNIGIYGGLLTEDPSEEDVLHSVLPSYAGKFVIFLGNQFVTGDNQAMSLLKVCDAESLQEACDDHTSCLFFGANNDPAGRASFEGLLRPIQDDPVAIANSMPDTLRFQKQEDLIRCLQRSGGDGSKYHLLKVSKSMLRKDASNVAHAAKKLAASLREKVPHSHFVVGMIPAEHHKENGKGDGSLLVWQGLCRTAHLEATTSELFSTTNTQISQTTTSASGGLQRALTLGRKKAPTLSAFDRLCILGSVPFFWRLKLLNDRISDPLKAETTRLVVLSVCSQIDHEIQTFLAETEWPNSIDMRDGRSLEDFLPSVYQLVSSFMAAQTPSPQLLSVIAYCQASSRPQNSKQSFSQKVVPFGHRRRQLFNHIAKTITATAPSKSVNGRLKKAPSPKDSQIFNDSVINEPFLAPPNGRCTSSSLIKMISQATGKSQHFQERARHGICNALDRNDIFDLAEWRQHAQRSKDQREEMLQLFYRFQEEKEKYGMNTDESAP